MTTKAVLHLTGMTCTKYGSLERYLVEVVAECRRAGYASVLQYEAAPRPADYVADLERLSARVVATPTGGNPAGSLLRLVRLIGQVRPEVVHCHFVEGFAKLWVPLLARALGVGKTISMVHNQPPYDRPHPARFAYNAYTHVLPVSDAVRASLLAGGVSPGKTRTHYLGLFGDRSRSAAERSRWRTTLSIPDDAVVLACIAFDAPFKGIDILLDALSLLCDRLPGVHLVSVGVEPGESGLPGMARRLGIESRVRWAGIRDEGWKVLNAADLYVQPSRSGEGLPLAVMEAMAMALPVVATRVSGNVEAVADGETGLVAEPEPAGLARVLEKLLGQPERWASLGEAGRRRFAALFQGKDSVERLVRSTYFA